jgi:AcrR family transcriptional regulator
MAATSEPIAVDRRQVRRDAKRTWIVDEAWKLAHRDGLAAISLRDLADQVGLRQPSLYAYFESKLDLYDVMFADGNRMLLDAVADQSTDGDPREVLAEFAARIVRFSGDDVTRHQLLFQRTIPGFEPSPESYRYAIEFYEIARERLAAAGIVDDEDIDVFTAVVAGLTHQQVANDPGGDRWVRQAGRVVEMFLADADRRRAARPVKGKKP